MVALAGWVLGVVSLALAFGRRALRPAVALAGIVLGAGVVAVVLGHHAKVSTMAVSYGAVLNAPPAERARIEAGAIAEASQSVPLGTWAGAPLIALSGAVFTLALARSGGRS